MGLPSPMPICPESSFWDADFFNTCQEPFLGPESPACPQWRGHLATPQTHPRFPGGPQRLKAPPRLGARCSLGLPKSRRTSTISLYHRQRDSQPPRYSPDPRSGPRFRGSGSPGNQRLERSSPAPAAPAPRPRPGPARFPSLPVLRPPRTCPLTQLKGWEII